MSHDPTFLILEGLLSETGEFQLLRGYEDTHATRDLRGGSNDRGVEVSLFGDDQLLLTSVRPTVRYPMGCSSAETRPGAGLLRVAVARSHQARRIVVTLLGRPVFEGAIAAERPPLEGVKVESDGVAARVSFDANADEIVLFAVLPDGRRLRPPADRAGSELMVQLASLEGLGQASFVVEATASFRTSRASTQAVALPPASVDGWITEPSHESTWPFHWRGSLVGNLFDANGRRLEWKDHQVAWLVNGKRLENGPQVSAWEAVEAGAHHIQLVHDDAHGQTRVLDEVTVTVMPPTAEQKEFAALLASRSARLGVGG